MLKGSKPTPTLFARVIRHVKAENLNRCLNLTPALEFAADVNSRFLDLRTLLEMHALNRKKRRGSA